MIDKNHCKINFDNSDICQFYDFENMREIIIDKNKIEMADLVLPSGQTLIHKKNAELYKHKRQINEDKIFKIQSSLDEFTKKRKEWKLIHEARKYNIQSKAIASQYLHPKNDTFNKHRQAVLHHWGNGGGGSHFHMSASKQFLKGVRISGVKQRRGGKKCSVNTQNAKQA